MTTALADGTLPRFLTRTNPPTLQANFPSGGLCLIQTANSISPASSKKKPAAHGSHWDTLTCRLSSLL
jgi:hypothetical protein